MNETEIRYKAGGPKGDWRNGTTDMEVSITSNRLNWAVLNIRFTHEGIIADLIEDNEVKKSFCMMYDEFVELLK
jgi:hypothetical protein